MKAASFEYSRAETLDQVLELLASGDAEARIIAGGQSLVAMMAMRLARPEHLVDINHVPAMAGIASDRDHVVIQTCTRQAAALRSALVAGGVPLLAAALPHVGHIQTRNRGTIGGSLAHGDPTAEILLVAVALGAEVALASLAGERRLAISDFALGPLQTDATDDECLIEVRFPTSPAGLSIGVSVDEISPRAGDYAVIGAAAEVGLDGDGKCRYLRLGSSGASPVPVRAALVEAALLGTSLEVTEIEEAARLVDPLLDPESDVQASASYRRRVAPGMLARVIGTAVKQAREKLS